MQKERFDEFQVAKRHRIGYLAFFLTIALVVINGIVKMNYLWADPLMEMFVLMYIPLIFVTVRMILKGAYVGRKDKNANLYIPMFGVGSLFSLFVIAQSIWSGVFAPIRDGKLDNSAVILFIAAYSTFMTIAMIIRRSKDIQMMQAEG